MANDGTIKIGTEILQDGLKKGMSVITGSIKKASQIAIGAMGAAATGIAAVGAASIAVGEEFESSFAKASTLFGDVAVDTDHLKQSILAVSDATGVAASELNESLYSALSAGVPVTEDMGEATAFLESSAKLAKAGFTNMDTALSATAKTLNAYGMDVSQADDIQKILIQTQNKGITTVGELGASLSQVTPTAAAFGVAFDQVGAALSNMTAQGTPTAQATTQLNSLIAELGKSGTIGAKSLEKAAQGTKYAGMGFKQMMESGASLNEVLDLMAKDAEKSGLSMVDMFSSIEAGKASLALSGENSQKFADNLEAMSTSADVVTEAYEKVTNTLEAKTGQIANSSKNLGIQIYNGIQEPLTGLADKGIEYMSQLSEAMKTDGISGMVEVGASILAEIAVGIAENIPELIDMAADMVLTFIEAIKTNLPQIVTAGIDIISSLADGIMDILPELLSLGGTLLLELVNGISEKLPELIPAAYETIMTLVEGFLDNIDKIIDAGINLLLALTDGLINTLPMLLEKAPVIIEKLCTALTENMPKIIEAAMQITMAINKGIVENLPLIIECAIKIIAAIAKGLIDSVGAAAESAGNVVNVIKDEFVDFNWSGLGSDILNGISKGIKGAVSSVKDAAKNAASSVLDTFKNFFDIHSPSRVMRDEVGKNIALGIADGITRNKKYAKKKAEEVAEVILQSAQKKLENTKVYNNLSLADEVAYWDGVRKQVKEGTQARIGADKEYLQAKKSLNIKMADIEQDYADKVSKTNKELQANIQALQDAYSNQVKSRTSEIMNSMNLFDEFTASTELTTEDLLKNLKSQVTGLKEWSSNLRELEQRGVTGDMLEELRSMGTDAAGEIALMTEMSDDELDEYVSLWKQKQRLARREATKELEPLLASTQNQIVQMRQAAEEELTKYRQQYVDAMAAIGVEIQQPLQQVQGTLVSTIAQAVQMVAATISSESTSAGNINQFAELAKQVLNASGSLPGNFTAIGEDTIAGMIQGLDKKSGDLYKAMADIINSTVKAAKEAAQIHSPSRIMRDLIGRNMIAGISVGFKLESDGLNNQAGDIIEEVMDSMSGKLRANEFVANMQAEPLRKSIELESIYGMKYIALGGTNKESGDDINYASMGKEMKKALNGTQVAIDGKKTGQIVAPKIDLVNGQDDQRKGMFTA